MKVLNKLLFVSAVFFIVAGKLDWALAAPTGSQIIDSQIQQDLSDQNNQKIENKLYRSPKPASNAQETQEQGAAANTANKISC